MRPVGLTDLRLRYFTVLDWKEVYRRIWFLSRLPVTLSWTSDIVGVGFGHWYSSSWDSCDFRQSACLFKTGFVRGLSTVSFYHLIMCLLLSFRKMQTVRHQPRSSYLQQQLQVDNSFADNLNSLVIYCSKCCVGVELRNPDTCICCHRISFDFDWVRRNTIAFFRSLVQLDPGSSGRFNDQPKARDRLLPPFYVKQEHFTCIRQPLHLSSIYRRRRSWARVCHHDVGRWHWHVFRPSHCNVQCLSSSSTFK